MAIKKSGTRLKAVQLCRYCQTLGVKVACEHCWSCRHCGCHCRLCPACRIKHPPGNQCNHCHSCRWTCTCRHITYGIKNLRITGTRHVNTLVRPLGLEIELSVMGDDLVYNMGRYAKTCEFRWDAVRDGSIQGGQPTELVIHPLATDNYITAVGGIVSALAESGSEVNESCGFHVHVGGRPGSNNQLQTDYGPYDFRRLLRLYSTIEHDIYRYLVEPRRASNIYAAPMVRQHDHCVTTADIPGITTNASLPPDHRGVRIDPTWVAMLFDIKDSRSIQSHILQWLYLKGESANWEDKWRAGKPPSIRWQDGLPINRGPSAFGAKRAVGQMRTVRYTTCRYSALNLHSWFYRGTIEWRHHQSTLDFTSLVMWPLFCGWIVELASILTDNEALQITSLSSLVNLEWKRPLGGNRGLPEPIKNWLAFKLKGQPTAA